MRKSSAIRDMVRETTLAPSHLVYPMFVIDGQGDTESIDTMPGVLRYPIAKLVEECQTLYLKGLRAVALFPKLDPTLKTEDGDEALNPKTLILRACRAVKDAVPELTLIADIALDPYTTHGHDGVLTEQGDDVDNDATLERLAEMAVLHARAGVDFVAPSDMMDGRVAAIREELDDAGYTQTGIIAYSAKFNSAFYGPFRDAVGSSQAAGTQNLSKATYQLDPANRREALMECELDEDEGADVLMVKPAGAYLDIIRQLREQTALPVAAYQVSGEYSMIHAAANAGCLDYSRARDESLLAIRRAGADMIFTYFAKELLD